jgi:thiamine pyrophosphate-dependent acetolactate synthase large subunit-like protein
MLRRDAIEIIKNRAGKNTAIISSTGLISRELFDYRDDSANLYMVGSLGLASSIALGIAVSKNIPIIVIDGDASVLMNLGSLVSIGRRKPKNLIHIVLDNDAYASCSEEKSMSDTANLAIIAKKVGYRTIFTVKDQKQLDRAIRLSRKMNGPIFIHVLISLGGRRDLPRPLNLENIARNFKLFLLKRDDHARKID